MHIQWQTFWGQNYVSLLTSCFCKLQWHPCSLFFFHDYLFLSFPLLSGNCLPPQRLFLLWLSVCSSTFLHFLHLYMFFYGFSLWNLCHLSMVSFLQFFHGEFSAFYGWFLVVKFFRFLKLNFCICFVVFFMNLCLSCSFFLFF